MSLASAALVHEKSLHDKVGGSVFEREEQARIRATLSRVAAFRDLPPTSLDSLARTIAVRRIPGGAILLSEDDGGDSVYILMAGRVKVVHTGETGREVTLAVLRPTEMVGDTSLFDGGARTASFVALEPVTALAVPRGEFMELLARHPVMSLALLAELSRRIRRADQAIVELALCDVEQRLVRRLAQLAREDATPVDEGLLIRRRPTQQDLANMVGSCRETVSRMVNALARQGLVISRGRSLVVTSQLLSGDGAGPPPDAI